MSTVVRSVRKVVLFVLVMSVSGVGAAHADPGVAPLHPETVVGAVTDSPAAEALTPEVVRQSVRLYATAEQVRPASTSGGAEHWFSKTAVYSDSRVNSYTEWAFYKINGDETNFFVDTVTIAQGKDEYKVKHLITMLNRPSSASSNARWKEWEYLGGKDEPVTLSLAYGGASISRTLPASPDTSMNVVGTSSVANALNFFYITMGLYYEGDFDDADYSDVITGGYLSRWEGGPPWGMKVSVSGGAISSRTGDIDYWGETQWVEEPR